ncbi:unnamed protein product [Leuciscus chuanchicus]
MTSLKGGRSEEDIQATVLQAKKDMADFTHTGRFWEYQRIRDILGASDPLASLLEEMDRKGLVVRNIPPLLPAPSSVPHSSTTDAQRLVEDIAGKTRSGSGASTSRQDRVDERTAFDMLVESCPVTLDGHQLCGEHEQAPTLWSASAVWDWDRGLDPEAGVDFQPSTGFPDTEAVGGRGAMRNSP